MSPDIQNQEEIARKERSAYTRMMNALMTLEGPSRMKVLGAVAIMVKPTLAPESLSTAPVGEPT